MYFSLPVTASRGNDEASSQKLGAVSSPLNRDSSSLGSEQRNRLFLAICRTVNFKRMACGIVQNGNGCWLNIGGGRRTSVIQVRDGTILKGKGYG